MTPELAFSAANLVAVLSWGLLVALPRRRWVSDTVAGIGVPALLAAIYVMLIATNWSSSSGGFSTLANVALLFANPWMLLAGWVHYLCFDLLVGCWAVRDAARCPLSHPHVHARTRRLVAVSGDQVRTPATRRLHVSGPCIFSIRNTGSGG